MKGKERRNASTVRVALFVSACFFSEAHAAPLTWFPGPAMKAAVSSAATTMYGPGNMVIGGESDGYPSGYVESLVATNTSWTTPQAYFPFPIIAQGAVSGGDTILVFGGSDGTSATSAAYSYSPSGDGTVPVPSMNVARAYLGYTADSSGNAYAIGGLDQNNHSLASAEAEQQDGTNWSFIASMPVAKYEFPAVCDQSDLIYVFGGRTNPVAGAETATVFRYSISADAWTTLPPMPVATAGSTAAYGADGKIYVVGGTSGGIPVNAVQVYDPSASTWTISTPLPEALTASAMGIDILGRLVVMGGSDTNRNDVADVWRSQQLGTPDIPPVLTQLAATNAVYGATNTYTIAATGNPQPVYVLVSGPANMSVDYFTGVVTWAPQGGSQIGNIPVTLAATNYAGVTNWSFAITVPPPPPVTPTNLTVVAVSDTNATLAWAPEDPLVGPVKYVVYWVHSSGGRDPVTIYTPMATNYSSTSTTLTLAIRSTHTFVVTASANGHTTGYSQGVTVTTTSPQPPTGIQVAAVTSTTLTLSWTNSPGPAQSPAYSVITSYSIAQYVPYYGGYTLNYKTTGIATNSLNGIVTGTVTGLTPGASAFWTVQAFDGQGFASPVPYNNIIAVTNPTPVNVTALNASLPPNGQFTFTARGAAGQTAYVETTTNVADPSSWTLLTSFMPTNALFVIVDTNSPPAPARFYRVTQP